MLQYRPASRGSIKAKPDQERIILFRFEQLQRGEEINHRVFFTEAVDAHAGVELVPIARSHEPRGEEIASRIKRQVLSIMLLEDRIKEVDVVHLEASCSGALVKSVGVT